MNNNTTIRTLQEELDHIAARVTASCVLGALAGSFTAVYNGHLLGRTMLLSSLSCGMAATACFSAERLASAALQQLSWYDAGDEEVKYASRKDVMVATHAIGGTLGGALVGALYGRGKPIQGALFLTPLMVMIGLGQQLLDDVRHENQQQVLQFQPRQDQQLLLDKHKGEKQQ